MSNPKEKCSQVFVRLCKGSSEANLTHGYTLSLSGVFVGRGSKGTFQAKEKKEVVYALFRPIIDQNNNQNRHKNRTQLT